MKELILVFFRLTAFIGASYLLLGDIRQSIGLGYIIFLLCTQLDAIRKNLAQ
jgi:hypothetical protein